jgi:purine-binding chemotaxis protein CheW
MRQKQTNANQVQTAKSDVKDNEYKLSSVNDLDTSKNFTFPVSIDAKLVARAQAMAKEEHDDKAKYEYTEIIEFQLGSENYAIETEFVRELCLLNNFTPLPGLPDFVLGIINLRGQILSIIDLKILLNLPASGLGELNKIIIIQNDKMEFGILADKVIGTYSLNSLLLRQSSKENIPGTTNAYLKTVTSDHLIILDAKALLEDEKIVVNHLADL